MATDGQKMSQSFSQSFPFDELNSTEANQLMQFKNECMEFRFTHLFLLYSIRNSKWWYLRKRSPNKGDGGRDDLSLILGKELGREVEGGEVVVDALLQLPGNVINEVLKFMDTLRAGVPVIKVTQCLNACNKYVADNS